MISIARTTSLHWLLRPDTQRATERSEALLVLAMALYRGFGLPQIVFVLVVDARKYNDLPLVLALAVAVAIGTCLFVTACVYRRKIRAGLQLLDVWWCCAALALGALVTAPEDGHSWAYFMYPFTMVSAVGLGFAYTRLSMVTALSSALVASYVSAALSIHHDPLWNVLPNALSYYANTTVAWAVATHLRQSAVELDASRSDAVVRAEELATEQERSRHARILHDRVLQTLEMLAAGNWIDDIIVRRHIAAEAAWLRALVEGAGTDREDDLLTGLQRLVEEKALGGLRVEVNAAAMTGWDGWRRLRTESTAVVVDAANEALNNVVKHAGVTTAFVRVAVRRDVLCVTIVDHGSGFDVQSTSPGVGLTESIFGRLQDAGGSAAVSSQLGHGTTVELRLPMHHQTN